jgi:predicted nucleic acid-binding protein
LVKGYVREAGSVSVRRLLAAGQAAASRLSEVEVASALARRSREGAFSIRERDRALAAFVEDFAALIVVELAPEVAAGARELLVRHRLRAGDAIQLASGLFLQQALRQPVPFVAFDDRLSSAARDEGMTVVSRRR